MEYENGYEQHIPQSKYECLLFDVDDTLYSRSSGLSSQCTINIREYMVNKLGMEESKVPEICAQLYRDYGTTMAGLWAFGYKFDNDDYHSDVHGRLPYENLKPDPVLRTLLHSLPIRKVIFSNANEAHVAEVLHRLGLEDCFDDVICFESLNPTNEITNPDASKGCVIEYDSESADGLRESPIVCKPFENAFQQAFQMANINPHKTIFFDDSIRNIQASKLTGLTTVLVGSSQRKNGVDYALESIHNIREALPELWESVNKTIDVDLSQQIAIETRVEA
ncbi:HAD-like domain-containing protein [Artemisia annua]|uniref:HAD-like domain-containing protein n=1 Tax=Artemisia annua TaxID=35608 RepID=A0A2U1KVH8_ARTAN|nr:HAD-like domain-containing protein [Artemisia annua]